MAEAYSHEVSSCGFWPGNGGYGRAAFYVYAYPEPAGYGEARLPPPRRSTTPVSANSSCPMTRCGRRRDPDALLLGFLQETYAAAAEQAALGPQGARARRRGRAGMSRGW